MNISPQKKINYSYGYAVSAYEKLKKYEISTAIPKTSENDAVIIRLDGKGVTARFKNETDLFVNDFHLAMKRVIEKLPIYFDWILFAYSFKDEISLLVNENKLVANKDIDNRVEKLLPITSGYVSAMFSQFIPKELKQYPTESFSFDTRIIVIPRTKLKDYFHSRQAFAMIGFIDRLCSFKKLKVNSRTLVSVKAALKQINDNWSNYPQYVCLGYVGFQNNKWTVETASDFNQKWNKYTHYLGGKYDE